MSNNENVITGPLTGLRVVDSTTGGGELAGRLLADLGAEVILVEPPGGSASRNRYPLAPNGESLGFAWRNANKRGVVADRGTHEGQATLRALLADADVWIEDQAPGGPLDAGEVAASSPELVVTSITPFGRTGPHLDLPVNDDVLAAWSGYMFKAGIPEKPPLLPPTPMASDVAAVTAAMATCIALRQRDVTGSGQHIDLAVMTAAAATTDWSYSNASVMRAAERPYHEVRQGGGFMYPIFACLDGWVRMIVMSPRQWSSLWEWMGEPEAFADPFWAQIGNRIGNADVLCAAYEEFFADKKMLEICDEGQRRGIVVTPLLTVAEVLTDPHLTARGTFTPAEEVAPGAVAPVVSGFIEVDGRRQGWRHRAPLLDEHAGASFATARRPRPEPDSTDAVVAPLAGLRVLDFGIGGVGVEASRVFAEYGADVIKVETRTYPDFIRLVALSEMSPSFASSSRSKRSLGVNAKTDKGLELVKRLVEQSDVLIENSATGVMAGLGLGHDDLLAINPGIIMVSSQLVGSRGPNAHWIGYGPTTQNYGGLLSLWDYADEDPPATNTTIFPDHLAGRLCALTALASLLARTNDGRGRHGEVAQVEAVVNLLGERMLQEALTPGSAVARGNASEEFAPRGPFACEGEQQWVVISVQTDAEWQALVKALGAPSWATAPELASAAGRLAAAQSIERDLGAWTATRSRREVVDQLVTAGVPCGPMQTGSDLLDDPHLAERGWNLEIEQPGAGAMKLEGPAWMAASMIGPRTTPAPGLGGDTREVATELLGLAASEVDELIAAGVLEE